MTFKAKSIQELIKRLTLTELYVLLNKYCSNDAYLISYKKFGLHIPDYKQQVEEEIMERVLLGNQ